MLTNVDLDFLLTSTKNKEPQGIKVICHQVHSVGFILLAQPAFILIEIIF